MVELFAPVLALSGFAEELRGKRCLVMVDAEAIEAALVKGYSSRSDLSELTGKFWKLAAELDCLVFVDRVPTDSNPADRPSRPDKCNGLEEFGWERRQVRVPPHLAEIGKRAWEKVPGQGHSAACS
jgi:hypothetical protein